MLALELLRSGQARDIYALVSGSRNATKEYIDGLQRDSKRKLVARLNTIAEQGWAGHEDQVVRHLKGSRVACEVKEHASNTRLFCFCHGRRVIVCTHGGPKPGRRQIKTEIEKVERLYEECLREGLLQ